MDRRRFIRRSVLLGAVVTAGCSGGGEETGEPPGTETDDQTAEGESGPETATPSGTEESETLPESDVVSLTGGPCEAVDSATFKSIEKQPGGPAPDDESTAFHWRVRFGDGEFSYSHTDVVESGSYSCTAADGAATIEATAGPDRTYTGTYDAQSGILEWDGVQYRPVARS